MADQGLDLAALAAPIAGESPVGVDLRKDYSPQSTYFRLRDARSEARMLERQAETDPGTLTAGPHWATVRTISLTALRERTKDLEIAVWLTEALIRDDGFSGLAFGATLLADLVDGFWDSGVFPERDEDADANRLAAIGGLNETLLQPLGKCPLFTRGDRSPVALWQYRQAETLEGVGNAADRKRLMTNDTVTLEQLARDAVAAGPTHFAALRTTLVGALEAWTRLGARLDAVAGRNAPATGKVSAQLRDMLDIANRYAPPEEPEPSADDDVPAAEDQPRATPGEAASSPAGRAATREEMLRELTKIAHYFRRTEPHSPLAYTLEEAVRRGRLTWPELLEEVVPDGGARSAILVMLGIRPTPPTE